MQRSSTNGCAITSARSSVVNKSTSAGKNSRTGDDGKIEELQGRSEIVHKHFCELCTDTTNEGTPEWIERRWLRETLEPLPMIDGERIREITWAFRKRTSCVEDQVVIEMLRELGVDVWDTIANCFR